jgi:sporulation protein YlmC with PRC-barrel domain
MNYPNRNRAASGKTGPGGQSRSAKSATTTLWPYPLIGEKVTNLQHEYLGQIEEIMLDLRTGQVAYAVLSVAAEPMPAGQACGPTLTAVPWQALSHDSGQQCLILNQPKQRFLAAPGFDAKCWPNMADQLWADSLARYYAPQNH